ncbi:E3 ubiquitin-protein ligase RNF25-like isoform X1 [Stegodyphus dumicola]|uniref:E3 ubiquitin-protein ligase RNF25-like isoform X1 n=1 Tax=Stegodyphus dumicola TaxID=202533 RepID=UPI0015B191B2|nr:E3 ubiquitin-protein ligase RNF25-like isoform X1 [Stegodyphus dumicola]XP_035228271.1 E3 ubiquitin-protein ligase RNF25-like isoform X1 [Stegodyphus dumicola]XP_035228272.1 E3 ubiquitin-protein ligase RNF25-like isoform X1 [Stegodyphus dumicola]XP_035228273.1 E3 ubiquitin-protein ligase RNF25-like isoform X1 [Stegodyphus dumicola]
MEEIPVNESDDLHSFLDVELEALQSIYVNEITIIKDELDSTSVSIDLYPATADNLHEQYVRMTLKFTLKEKYPEELPEINIRNPRGLSEEKLRSITDDLLSIAEKKKGNSMLFEMIEAAKEHLTAENRPSGECAICLYGFNEQDVFTRTECYHYFHSHCLARYSKNALENNENNTEAGTSNFQLLCPMCRIPIQFEDSEELFPPPFAADDDTFIMNEEILELQKKMAELFQHQFEKGGIIDIEAEKNKFLLEISNVSVQILFI